MNGTDQHGILKQLELRRLLELCRAIRAFGTIQIGQGQSEEE
jgi:hypothetical protein